MLMAARYIPLPKIISQTAILIAATMTKSFSAIIVFFMMHRFCLVPIPKPNTQTHISATERKRNASKRCFIGIYFC